MIPFFFILWFSKRCDQGIPSYYVWCVVLLWNREQQQHWRCLHRPPPIATHSALNGRGAAAARATAAWPGEGYAGLDLRVGSGSSHSHPAKKLNIISREQCKDCELQCVVINWYTGVNVWNMWIAMCSANFFVRLSIYAKSSFDLQIFKSPAKNQFIINKMTIHKK